MKPSDLTRCLVALYPDGADWVPTAAVVAGCRAWGAEQGEQSLATATAVGIGRVVGGGVPGVVAKKTRKGRGFCICWASPPRPLVTPSRNASPVLRIAVTVTLAGNTHEVTVVCNAPRQGSADSRPRRPLA